MYDEESIIEDLKKGDTKALEKIMHRYQDYVYSILMQMLCNHEAKEAAQDSFLKVFKRISTFNGESKFSTWLYSIAYRTGLDYLKKRKPTVEIAEYNNHDELHLESCALSNLEHTEKCRYLNHLLSLLKPEDASILRLYYLDELTMKEICQITSLTESNLKIKLFRGRKALRELAVNNSNRMYTEHINVEL